MWSAGKDPVAAKFVKFNAVKTTNEIYIRRNENKIHNLITFEDDNVVRRVNVQTLVEWKGYVVVVQC